MRETYARDSLSYVMTRCQRDIGWLLISKQLLRLELHVSITYSVRLVNNILVRYREAVVLVQNYSLYVWLLAAGK